MAVHVDAVAALHVGDVELATLRANFGVKPGDALVVEHDGIALVTADADRVAAQMQLGFDGVAPENNQLGHVYLLRTPVCLVRTGLDERPSRVKAPEIAESIRSVTRRSQVGGLSATVSSVLSDPPLGGKSTVSSVAVDSTLAGAVSGAGAGDGVGVMTTEIKARRASSAH